MKNKKRGEKMISEKLQKIIDMIRTQGKMSLPESATEKERCNYGKDHVKAGL